jgi:hypothetical protein
MMPLPHGGKLIEKIIPKHEKAEVLRNLRYFKKLILTEN